MDYIHRVYRHYKGGLYFIIGTGVHTETQETMIIYKNYPDETFMQGAKNQIWIRPSDMFFGKVLLQDNEVDRFELTTEVY